MEKANGLIGQRFGSLEVISRDTTKPQGHGHKIYWNCRCSCGDHVSVRSDHLRGGKIKSCGHILGDNTKTDAIEKAIKNNYIVARYDDYSEVSLNGMVTLVNNDVAEKIIGCNWLLSTAGYLCRHGNDGKWIWLHRFIINAAENAKVDHKNRNRLDNRRENLRICTDEENARNAKIHKDNKCGFKGVYQSGNKFYAKISVSGESIPLGSYDTPEQAHAAYCKAAVKYFGEFACFG